MLFVFTCNIHKDAWIGQSYIATFDGTFSAFYSWDIQFKPLFTYQTYCKQKSSVVSTLLLTQYIFNMDIQAQPHMYILVMPRPITKLSHHPQTFLNEEK